MRQQLWLISFLLACAFFADAQGRYFISNNRRVDVDAFNREVQTMIDDMGVPAVSVAIIENNEVVFANTYGYRRPSEKLRANKNTVFEACSLSKSYLVFAVHKLVEEGRLDLDKPMYQYLPNQRLEHDQRYKLITPRMILAHNTGMENWKSYNNPDTLEILSTPGEKFSYSGEAYNYLATVVALIQNAPYEQYINELVMRPLNLHHSYVVFKEKKGLFHKESPANYAYGHDYFGNEMRKWKNRSAVPSSANNVTAKDYAKLVIATFDKKHLSAQSIKTILQPLTVVRTTADNTYYYGAGFEVFYVGGDTIIAHGGSNAGFKAEIFYSIPNKRGFVFMSNSDLGRLMSQRFSELTAGLAIQQYFKNPLEHQYPSTVLSLLKTFRQKNGAAMMQEYDQLNASGKIDIDSRNELAHVLMEQDTTIAMKLLQENYTLNKDLPDVNCLLGDAYLEREQWNVALKYYLRAQDLNFSLWPIRPSFLQDLRNRIAEDERRKLLSTNIQNDHDTRVEAEDYSSSRGIRLKPSADTGSGQNVNFIDAGDWMDYQLNISEPGIYSVAFRVASLKGGGEINLQCANSTIASVHIPSTGGWDKWTTVTQQVKLPAGAQTIRLYTVNGGFDLNWLQFSKNGITSK